jgi:hypothetical protein
MKLADLFETRAQEQVHRNPSVNTLKSLARNNKYHSARFVITKDGDVVAADSMYHTHHSMAPYDGAWAVRGYVQYMGDGEYAYRSMAVYSALNKDHPILRIWEKAGIQNGNPDQSHLEEAWSTSYKKSINCSNPKGFSQRAHCAARKKRQAGHKTKSKSISESVQIAPSYNAWIRYTPESLHADWSEYVHKQDAKWHTRAKQIGARWPLFTNMHDFKQALDQAPIVNVDELADVGNMTRNHSLQSIRDMVSGYQNPRDVDRIVAGMHAGVPLPLPIILKGRTGMWIQAGNTRQATARVLGVTPKALLVDVSTLS